MPKNTTILALAAAAASLATAAAAVAEEYGETTTAASEAAPEAPEKGKRGRPAKEKEEPAGETFKTYDELKEIIKPLVDAKRAPDVKAILKKLGVETGMKDLPNEKQAEFLKDVEALLNDTV